MRYNFKIVITLLVFVSFSYGLGTGFLAVPVTADNLALGQHPVWSGATLANPAMVADGYRKGRMDAGLHWGHWLGGVSKSAVNLTWHTQRFSQEVNIRYLGLDDLEQRTDRPTDEPLSTFAAVGSAIDWSLAGRINRWRLGLSTRLIHLRLYTEESSGLAMDFGVARNWGKRVVLGASLLNVGWMSPLRSESPELPVRGLIGGRYTFSDQDWQNVGMVSVEITSLAQSAIVRLANELTWHGFVLQMGTQLSAKVTAVSGGIGFTWGRYQFRYATQVGSQDLGLPSVIDIQIEIP